MTTVLAPPPRVARLVSPRRAQPLGVKSARRRITDGALEMKTKLPPSSARPKVSSEAKPSAWRWLRATPMTSAVRHTTAITIARQISEAPSQLPQCAPKAVEVTTAIVPRLTQP